MSGPKHTEGFVVRYVNVIKTCPKHGLTEHLGYLGGACCRCHHEGLVAQGLVKP